MGCEELDQLIPDLRQEFNEKFTPEGYAALLRITEERCGVRVDFRIAETPVFLPLTMLEQMARSGARLAETLIGNRTYLDAARMAIPNGYHVASETAHPNFLTADFALVREQNGELAPRLVEIQAFPSVFGYQDALSSSYREVFDLPASLGSFLGGLDETTYWDLLARTILGTHDPAQVVLTEIDPQNQKTLPDFLVTARRLGIAVVDIRNLEPVGNQLHYRNSLGGLVPVRRIYNRAIADELISRQIQLPFDLTRAWDVEWAGHPDWYFLISKFSIPHLADLPSHGHVVPPAVFLNDFLEGNGRAKLANAGVPLPEESGPETVYTELLLKPLF